MNPSKQKTAAPDDDFWPGPKQYDVEVVGESHYQKNLLKLAGPKSEDGVRQYCRARLVLETDNPKDKNAVRVDIDGLTVGHLARTVAPAVRAALGTAGVKNGMSVQVEAVIAGGREDQMYGVWLDIPTAPKKIDPWWKVW